MGSVGLRDSAESQKMYLKLILIWGGKSRSAGLRDNAESQIMDLMLTSIWGG